MPFRAGAPFLPRRRISKAWLKSPVSMPSRAGALFLHHKALKFVIPYLGINALSGWGSISTGKRGAIWLMNSIRINALSGWGSISTVPLRKPRFYAVSEACFCRYLSEYSDNDHFSCMLTIWTYLIATSYLGLF